MSEQHGPARVPLTQNEEPRHRRARRTREKDAPWRAEDFRYGSRFVGERREQGGATVRLLLQVEDAYEDRTMAEWGSDGVCVFARVVSAELHGVRAARHTVSLEGHIVKVALGRDSMVGSWYSRTVRITEFGTDDFRWR